MSLPSIQSNTSSIANSNGTNGYETIQILAKDPEFPIVERFHQDILEPIYGNQKRTLDKIADGIIEKCEMLFFNKVPVGIVVYETQLDYPISKYTRHRDCLNIKTVMILDAKNNEGKGHEIELVKKIIEIAKKKFDHRAQICIWERASIPLDFFISQGFRNIYDCNDESAKDGGRCYELQMEFKEPNPLYQGISDTESKKRKRTDLEAYEPEMSPAEPKRTAIPQGPKFHSATLKKEYIHLIRDGKKTVEGRINSGMFAKFKEGDKVRFFYYSQANDDVKCHIIKVEKFASFREMLEKTGVEKCLPGIQSVETGAMIYDRIPGYREKSQLFGVIAIHLIKM